MTEYRTDKMVELLGEAQPVSMPPKKENLMSFRDGSVYMALRLVTPYDKDTQQYIEPVPKLVFVVNGKYVKLPMDSGLLDRFGVFMTKVAQAVQGVEVREPEIDMDAVMEKMRGISGQGA